MENPSSNRIDSCLKIATLNLCLGLKFKKDLVKNIIMENKIEILVMQETEVEPDFYMDLLNIPGYGFESVNNRFKKRVGVYINNSIKYERC